MTRHRETSALTGRRLKTTLAILCLALSDCATGYQPNGFGGGFSETRVAPDTFWITYRGNARTSNERIRDLILLRGADLTLQNGYTHFAVTAASARRDVRTVTLPGESYTVGGGSVDAFGNVNYRSSTVYDPPTRITRSRPRVNMTIRCFKGQPQGVKAYDAAFIKGSLGPQYLRP